MNPTINQLCIEILEIKPIRLKENGGLGNALRIGIENVSNGIVARMDADEISLPDRF
ncbi:MAG: glycosyltransferase [Muribaculaceae bacterium]|nr:glycosyltransferase [Muribaculaceae bacterium]